MSQRYFAVISPGLEDVLDQELRSFKVRKREVLRGGVAFDATARGLCEVLQWSRLAQRVYLRLTQFRAKSAIELYQKTRRFDWSRIVPSGCPLAFSVSIHQSRLYGTGQVSDRVFDGIRDALGPAGASPVRVDVSASTTEQQDGVVQPLRILVRLEEDQCQLSLDASGGFLHRRGWRHQTGSAPLRENLAAALLVKAGWSPGMALVDPMCGSGTFLIEAARWCAGLPPRLWGWEAYAYSRWSHPSLDAWESATSRVFDLPCEAYVQPSLLGFDLDQNVVSIAMENAQRAGIDTTLSFGVQSVSALEEPPCPSGVMIANPPYGERIARKKVKGKAPERILMERFLESWEGWTLALLVPADWTLQMEGLEAECVVRFRNGGLPVGLWVMRHESSPT